MQHPVVELAARVAEMDRRLSQLVRHGTVEQVDAAKARVRLRIGEGDDGPLLSPWVPYGQIAGALKLHSPPSVGQQMTLCSPSGDVRQAVAMPMTWSNQNSSPSTAGDQHVLTFGGFTITLKGDELHVSGPKVVLECGGTSLTLDCATALLKSDDVTFDGRTLVKGESLKHNAKNVGDSHKHKGVIPGGGITQEPV